MPSMFSFFNSRSLCRSNCWTNWLLGCWWSSAKESSREEKWEEKPSLLLKRWCSCSSIEVDSTVIPPCSPSLSLFLSLLWEEWNEIVVTGYNWKNVIEISVSARRILDKALIWSVLTWLTSRTESGRSQGIRLSGVIKWVYQLLLSSCFPWWLP